MNAAPRRPMTPPEASARRFRREPGRAFDGVRSGAVAGGPHGRTAPRWRPAVAPAARSHGGSHRAREAEAAGSVRRSDVPAAPIPARGHDAPLRSPAAIVGMSGPGTASAGRAASLAGRPPIPVRRRTGPYRDRVAAASTGRDAAWTGRDPADDAVPDTPETGPRAPPPGPHGDATAPPDPD